MSLSTVPNGQPPAIGHYRLLAPLSWPALRDWFDAVDTVDGTPVWLYVISDARLKTPELDRHPPSLKLARKHASLTSPGLQNLSAPDLMDGQLLIAATPAVGQPLRDFIASQSNQTLSVSDATQVIQKIAVALSAIHRHGLVHGRVGIDQVWWNSQQELTLLRDPFFPPVSPLDPSGSSTVGTQGDRESRVRYAAPEFTAPGQVPTYASDIYSLGCLWWELLVGRAPFSDSEIAQVPSQACKVPLMVPKEVGLSAGLRKCLEHMLAKNPSSRFANCDQLLLALDAASTVALPAAPVIQPPTVPASGEQKLPPRKADVVPSKPAAQASTVSRLDAAPLKTSSTPTAPNPPTAPPPEAKATSKEVALPVFSPPVAPPPVSPPSVSQPPVSQPPVSQPLVSQPPVSQPPVSQPPVSQPPVSQPPVSQPPVSQPPVSQPPAAQSPATISLNDPLGTRAKVTKPSKPAVSATSARPGARRSSKKKGRPVWLIPAMLAGCIVVLGGLAGILAWTGSGATTKQSAALEPKVAIDQGGQIASVAPESPPTPAPGTKARVVDPLEDQYMIAKGDDSIPWIPPRASQPYSLAMLPPGAQGFIFVRPSAWLSTASGQAIVESLSNAIESIWNPMEKSTGVSIENVRELAIGLYGGRSDGWPVLVYRVELEEPTTFENLREKIQGASEQTLANQRSMLVTGDQAIYLSPPSEVSESTKQALTLGPVALIRELAEMEGGAPLRRQMEQLWQVSDARSDLSLLLSTGFFFSDARNVLPSISPRLQSLCKEMFDEKTQAILFSTSLEPQWYGELRTMGQSSDDATRFTADFQSRMKSVADRMESELVASPAIPYWRAIAARFPQMLRSLVRYQRFGVENGQAISNFYLPSVASANMAIAAWMSLQMPAGSSAGATIATQSPAAVKLTGDALLAHLVSINFEQEPLDSALALITEEVNRSLPPGSGPIELSIDGKSFELASVTRNQQIRDFRFKEKPLRDLLTDLAARVNPDRTVKSLDEEKQAVVWMLYEESGKSRIVFTTRRGLEGSDRKLPKEFSKATP